LNTSNTWNGRQNSWIANHQGTSFIGIRKVFRTTPSNCGILNGPTANFVVAAALVSVVAVNDLGTRFATLLERFDICTAQEVVDAALAIAVTLPQTWYSIESPTSSLNELLVDKRQIVAPQPRAFSFTGGIIDFVGNENVWIYRGIALACIFF
jgi:hypothetical protein